VPLRNVHGMGLQVSSWFVEFVIKIKIKVMRLQIHDEEHGGHRTGKLAEGIIYILGLEGNAVAPGELLP